MQHDKKPRYGGVFYYTELQIKFYSIRILLKLPASWSHVEGVRIHSGTDYNCRLQNLSFAPMLEARSDTYISVRWWDNSYKLQRSGGHMFFHNLL